MNKGAATTFVFKGRDWNVDGDMTVDGETIGECAQAVKDALPQERWDNVIYVGTTALGAQVTTNEGTRLQLVSSAGAPLPSAGPIERVIRLMMRCGSQRKEVFDAFERTIGVFNLRVTIIGFEMEEMAISMAGSVEQELIRWREPLLNQVQGGRRLGGGYVYLLEVMSDAKAQAALDALHLWIRPHEVECDALWEQHFRSLVLRMHGAEPSAGPTVAQENWEVALTTLWATLGEEKQERLKAVMFVVDFEDGSNDANPDPIFRCMPHLRDDRLREHNPEGTRTWAASAAELVAIAPLGPTGTDHLARLRRSQYSEEVKELQAQYRSVCGHPPRGRSAAQAEWLQKKIREAQSNTN
jgi:hypothetical protein